MQWHSVSEFFAMGGYAVYVWGSFGLCALAMIAEPWLLRRRHRQILSALRRRDGAAGAAPAWTGARAEVAR
jgi:heme exporter protein D